MFAPIVGPGALSFWWKISAVESNHNLYFSQGYWQTDALTGPRDWSRHTALIGPGTNMVTWTFYGKGATAWVDRVEFVPEQRGAAVLALQPPNFWGDAVLRINGELARPYQIEMSTNLIDWVVRTNVVRTDPYPYPQLSVATNLPALFFRATTH